MKILLHHQFWSDTIKWSDAFYNVNSIEEFDKKLKKIIKNHIKNRKFLNENDSDNFYYKLLGDGGEIFTECLIFQTEIVPPYKITDYKPTEPDYEGVDGYGVREGHKVAVQVKWYNETKTVSGSDGIHSFKGKALADLMISGDIPDITGERPRSLILITSGKGLSYLAEKNSDDLIQVIDRDILKRITDSEKNSGSSKKFWDNCYKMVFNTENHYRSNKE